MILSSSVRSFNQSATKMTSTVGIPSWGLPKRMLQYLYGFCCQWTNRKISVFFLACTWWYWRCHFAPIIGACVVIVEVPFPWYSTLHVCSAEWNLFEYDRDNLPYHFRLWCMRARVLAQLRIRLRFNNISPTLLYMHLCNSRWRRCSNVKSSSTKQLRSWPVPPSACSRDVWGRWLPYRFASHFPSKKDQDHNKWSLVQ